MRAGLIVAVTAAMLVGACSSSAPDNRMPGIGVFNAGGGDVLVTPWQGATSTPVNCAQYVSWPPKQLAVRPPWVLSMKDATTSKVLFTYTYSPQPQSILFDLQPSGKVVTGTGSLQSHSRPEVTCRSASPSAAAVRLGVAHPRLPRPEPSPDGLQKSRVIARVGQTCVRVTRSCGAA